VVLRALVNYGQNRGCAYFWCVAQAPKIGDPIFHFLFLPQSIFYFLWRQRGSVNKSQSRLTPEHERQPQTSEAVVEYINQTSHFRYHPLGRLGGKEEKDCARLSFNSCFVLTALRPLVDIPSYSTQHTQPTRLRNLITGISQSRHLFTSHSHPITLGKEHNPCHSLLNRCCSPSVDSW
jgi:hypothetical protein